MEHTNTNNTKQSQRRLGLAAYSHDFYELKEALKDLNVDLNFQTYNFNGEIDHSIYDTQKYCQTNTDNYSILGVLLSNELTPVSINICKHLFNADALTLTQLTSKDTKRILSGLASNIELFHGFVARIGGNEAVEKLMDADEEDDIEVTFIGNEFFKSCMQPPYTGKLARALLTLDDLNLNQTMFGDTYGGMTALDMLRYSKIIIGDGDAIKYAKEFEEMEMLMIENGAVAGIGLTDTLVRFKEVKALQDKEDEKEEAETIEEPAAPSTDESRSTNIPLITIEYDDNNTPIPPESCKPYAEMLATAGLPLAVVVGTLNQVLQSYDQCCQMYDAIPSMHDNPMYTIRAEVRAYLNALTKGDTAIEQKAVNAMQKFQQAAAEQMKTIQASEEGATYTEKLNSHNAKEAKKIHTQIEKIDASAAKERTRIFHQVSEHIQQYTSDRYNTKYGDSLFHILNTIENEAGQSGLALYIENLSWSKVTSSTVLRNVCLNIIDELCDPMPLKTSEVASAPHNKTLTWSPIKRSVICVVCIIASWSEITYYVKENEIKKLQGEFVHPDEYFTCKEGVQRNFIDTKERMTLHMNAITASLKRLEEKMQANGDYQKLSSIEEFEKGVLRQDRKDVLGQHPEYRENQSFFQTLPLTSETYGYDMDIVTNLLDPDMIQQLVMAQQVYIASMAQNKVCALYSEMTGGQTEPTMQCQPYVYWLLHIARQVNCDFHQAIFDLLPNEYYGNATENFIHNKIKGLARCIEKTTSDYTIEENAMPTAARLVDIVRCLIVCDSADAVLKAYAVIDSHFEIVRVKNSFCTKDAVPYNFRQILINVKFMNTKGVTMICEIQINLTKYVEVKEVIHVLYGFLRINEYSGTMSLLTKHVNPF